ncbi:putative actin patch assembly and actin polymerization protein [Podila epigama]|nr:putative actin patch assembly and actin polymerization protein [Podila epigama]
MGLFSKQTAITSQIDTITAQPTISQWEAVAALCEAVNAKDDGAKEAVKTLRKKLRLGKPQQQMNALTMATTKFAEDIEAVAISDATDANVKIQLMERLSDWADKFVGDPGLAIIPQLYYALVKNNTPRQQHGRGDVPSPPRAPITPEQQMRQMAQDIELARNNAHMLTEAISFADPDLEAIEENELIQEFHSKCQSLQRGIQQYLSEMTESANPNEQWLTSLLACNQELVQAFTAYNQMMERQHLSRVTKASVMTDVPTSQPTVAQSPVNETHDLISFGYGSGVGNGNSHGDNNVLGNGNGNGNLNGKHANGNGTSNGKAPSAAVGAAPPVSRNPFEDEPYFVTGPADVAAAVKMGKRPDNQDKIFDASAYFRQQQLEQEQLQALKDQQKALHLEQERINSNTGSGSSQAASPAQTRQ